MNAIEETVAAATDVSIPKEVITAHVQMVSNYATRGRVQVRSPIQLVLLTFLGRVHFICQLLRFFVQFSLCSIFSEFLSFGDVSFKDLAANLMA